MSNDVNVVSYSGKKLKHHLENYFTEPNKSRNLTFVKIDPSASYIKLDMTNDRKLYSFTENYHTRVKCQFSLDKNKEYYVFDDDIGDFNQMSESEQKNYLSTVKYDGLVIGEVDSNTIQKLLFSKFIKLDHAYNGIVTESNEVQGYYWYSLSMNGDYAYLSINNLKKYVDNVKITVAFPKREEKKPYMDYIIEKFANFYSTYRVYAYRVTEINPPKNNVQKVLNLYFRNENNETKKLFSLYFQPTAVGYNFTTIMNLRMNPEINDFLHVGDEINTPVSTFKYLVDKLNMIADAMERTQLDRYVRLGKVLRKFE